MRGGYRPGRERGPTVGRAGAAVAGSGPTAALLDPSRQDFDFSRCGQLAGGRHLEFFVADRLEQQAFLGPVEDDGRPQVTSPQDRRSIFEPETPRTFAPSHGT